MYIYRYHINKTVVTVDHSATVQLINIAEPMVTSYMEFDEDDEDFKIISGSCEKETNDL